MPKNKNKKINVYKLIKLIKSLKYEILIVFEVISLFIAVMTSSDKKGKLFVFFSSLSTLFGAYLTLSGVNYVKENINQNKLVDIISVEDKKDND